MNLVGKIFVVVLFVQSLAFMAFAVCVHGTHKNWMDEIYRKEARGGLDKGYAALLKDEQSKNLTLTNLKEKSEFKLESVQASLAQVIAKLEAERITLGRENARLNANTEEKAAERKEHIAIVNVTERRLTEIAQELITLRTRIADTRGDRNDLFEKVVTLTDAINALLFQQDILAETNINLLAEVTKYKVAFKNMGISLGDPSSKQIVVDGVVLAVGRENFVEISIGADDGLKTGHQLHVYRNDKYLGKIEVVRTTADKSVAKIDPGTNQGPIQKGDIVATKI